MTSTLAAQNGSGDYFNASDVLRHAIEDNTISVLYQPIFDVNTKRITSLDTIVRVHDAKGRTLAPYFVTAEAHRLNMSVQLTLDVLETCVKRHDRIPQGGTRIGYCGHLHEWFGIRRVHLPRALGAVDS